MPEPTEHSDVRYESHDATLGPVLAMGVGIVLLGLVAHFVCLWMFDFFKARAAAHDPGLPPLAAKERPILPQKLDAIPPPRLQVEEHADMKQFRQAEESRLNTYGWVDAKAGTVHMPIAEAMRLLSNPDFAKAKGIRVEPPKDKGGEL
jgi:hypothetical protein